MNWCRAKEANLHVALPAPSLSVANTPQLGCITGLPNRAAAAPVQPDRLRSAAQSSTASNTAAGGNSGGYFFRGVRFAFSSRTKVYTRALAGKMVRDTDFSHYNSAIDILPHINPPSMRSTSTLRPGRNRPGRIERPAQHFPPPNPRRRISKVWSRSLQLGQ